MHSLTTNNTPASGSTRLTALFGPVGSFLDEVAIEFGNACNGALRSAACHYQDLVMGRDCAAEEDDDVIPA